MSSDCSDSDLKLQAIDMLFDCPCEKEEPDCPFGPIRKMDVVKRVEWLRSASPEELRKALKQHTTCAGNSTRAGDENP